MPSTKGTLTVTLKSKVRRRIYVDEHISQEIAFQLRAMRKARGLTQTDVAAMSGTVQEVISKLEDPDYGRFSLRTLKRMAAAFDVDLIVRFAPYSERLLTMRDASYSYLNVPSFDDDPGPALL